MIMIKFHSKFQSQNVLVCFGGVQDSLEKIKNEFVGAQFKRIKQTHSDITVEASDNIIEADAHFTYKTNEALLIATADCIPIMIYCQQTHRAAAVHAGWRGVENKITEKTLQKLIATGSTDKKFKFWVGPHILQQSFEVDADVFQLLSESQYGLQQSEFAEFKNKKYFINLKKIVESQIQNVLGTAPDIVFSNIDTKLAADYYSYRRDQTTKRNLSFIGLIS